MEERRELLSETRQSGRILRDWIPQDPDRYHAAVSGQTGRETER